jgi:hypothetical protein
VLGAPCAKILEDFIAKELINCFHGFSPGDLKHMGINELRPEDSHESAKQIFQAKDRANRGKIEKYK